MLTENKSVFEIHVDKLKKIFEITNIYPYLIIMCSDINYNQTIRFFRENSFFDYPEEKIKFFKQGNLPACNEDYKIILESKTKIKQVPDGNGGIFDALKKSNILTFLKQNRIKWLQVSGVDNILLNILDPIFIAFAENSGLDIASSSVKREDANEKVGVFALKNGKPSVLEYTEIEEKLLRLKNSRGEYFLSDANIANHLFNINSKKFMDCSNLSFHRALKKIDYYHNGKIIKAEKPNAYKFEQFIFDAFSNFDKMAVLRVDRKKEFSPLKNRKGKDSVESARKDYFDIILKSKY